MRRFFLYIFTNFIFILLLAECSFSQWIYGSPFSTTPQSSSWNVVQNRPPVNEMLDSVSFPYPTNAWFRNLFLGQQTYPLPQGETGINKFHPYPYQLSLGAGYTNYPNYKSLLTINYKPFDVITGSGALPYVSWNTSNFLFLGSNEPDFIKPVILDDYSDLSFTVRFSDTTNLNNYYYAPIVRGMPYVTMMYNNIKPGVYFPSPAITKINDQTVIAGQQFTGTTFKIETTGINNTPNRPQTWMLFSSSQITLIFSQDLNRTGLICNDAFTGFLRIAHLTYQGENITPQQVTEKINLLTAYHRFIPVKGEVTASRTAGSQNYSFGYNFTRYNENSFSHDSLLMMALPHHVDILNNSSSNVLKYSVLKGEMSEVREKNWAMTETVPTVTWYPEKGDLSTVPVEWRDTLASHITSDFSLLFNRNSLGADLYTLGKTLARLGRILLITTELVETDSIRYAAVKSMQIQMRDSLKLYLGHLLDGGHTLNPVHGPGALDSIFYDSKFGGLISSLGWDSLNVNCCYSYGNALYNDHHFHYGYMIYTAAALAKTDPQWFQTNGNHYYNRVVDLIRDIANPSRSDGYFGLMRYKDWFEGHSWANGLVPFGDGSNQESSSEATNAWYGIYLFGIAMNNNHLYNTGGLLLQQEIRSTQKYYHIKLPQTNPVYPSGYTDKFHIAGNMFQSKLDAATFFSPESYAIHGIQVIPTTPVTEVLWDKDFATDIFNYLPNGLRHTPCFDSLNTSTLVWNWTTINSGIQAIAYPEEALSFFRFYGYEPANYDNGTSATNVLYWILTRIHNPLGITQLGLEIPDMYFLGQNYPNPFNPSTNINFSIPKKSFVSLVVYDILGREVTKLVQKELNAGTYRYELNGSNLSSGVYFYTLQTEGFVDTKRMVLLK